MSDEVGLADDLRLVFRVPGEGGDTDAAGEGAVAGDAKEFFMPTRFSRSRAIWMLRRS